MAIFHKHALSIFALALIGFCGSSSAAELSRLSRGMNFWEWFTGGGPNGVPDRTIRRGKVGPADIETLKKAGFDHVRIGISPYSLLPSPLPAASADFGSCAVLHDSAFVEDLEDAIASFNRAGIAVVVNVRFEGPAKDRLRKDPEFAVGCLGPFWVALATELASEFKPNDIFFDLINEPDIIATMPNDAQKWEKSAALWGTIQDEWIALIRQRVSSDYVIILSSDGWATANGVPYMRRPVGQNLIMSFHYYGSEVFTHQGQSWYNLLMGQISNLAYPPSDQTCSANLTKVDPKLNYGWYQGLVRYCAGQWSIANDLAKVRKWSADNGGFPIWVGEFGALAGAPLESRIRWYKDALAVFNNDGFIGHALVDYSDAIGCNRMADQSCVFVAKTR
jgi:aryl-phospho-beta-D-glucosidase BglC (GH1 family)